MSSRTALTGIRTLVGVLAGRRGELSPLSTALVTATALTGVGLGISVLRDAGTGPLPAS